MLKIVFTCILLFFTACFACTGQTKVAAKSLKITFRNVVDTELMALGNTYENKFGEDYTIRNFKYYISNFSIVFDDDKTSSNKNSHLINEADSNSKFFTIPVSNKSFGKISFLIGVDSIYNVSGTQTDDLDPARGMFWTWNSGYIMAKLEATSTYSKAPNNNVTYHIGGFKTGQNTTRKITLNTPKESHNNINSIVISANANAWFNQPNALKISDNPVCTTPGKLAVEIADNYANMFSISSIN